MALVFGVGGLSLLALASVISPQKRLIWNRTHSAPTGIFWVQDRAPNTGDLVLLSASAEAAIWAERHGFVGKDWPLLKYVAAQSGDKICRLNAHILINESHAATAIQRGSNGVKLPEWSGCETLQNDELFLLNAHPHSLDGRYFGPTKIDNVDGVAVLLFEIN